MESWAARLARDTALETPSVDASRADQIARMREKAASRGGTTSSSFTSPGPAMIPLVARPGSVPVVRPSSRAASLTAGQVEFLDALPAEFRDRFDAISPSRRDQLLSPHARGFEPSVLPVALEELRQVKAPPPALPLPTSLAELVARLGDGDATLAGALAEALCRDFGTEKDRDLWPAFHGLAQAVWRGRLEAADLIDAHRQAMGPSSRNRGAVFVTALRRHGWSP